MAITVKSMTLFSPASRVVLGICLLTACQPQTQGADPQNGNTNGQTSGSQNTVINAMDAMDSMDASAPSYAQNTATDGGRRRPPPLSYAAALALTTDGAVPQARVFSTNRPLSYDRALTAEDLQGRSLRDLAIMRNMAYARRGHRFRRPWLSEYFQTYDWYHPTRTVPDSDLSPLELANARAVADYDQHLTQAILTQMKDALLDRDRRRELFEGDNVEAVLLSTRLGTHLTLASYTLPTDTSPLDDPSRLDELIPREELLQMSQRDLWLLRNMIYARRGRPFRSISLTQAFDGADWYHPDQHYNDSALRRVDRQNIRLIQSIEAEIGGPTSARDEDAAFQGA